MTYGRRVIALYMSYYIGMAYETVLPQKSRAVNRKLSPCPSKRICAGKVFNALNESGFNAARHLAPFSLGCMPCVLADSGKFSAGLVNASRVFV